jgi:hypothetical protein
MTKDGVWMGQEAYINQLLAKYGMSDCHPVKTPMDTGDVEDSPLLDSVAASSYRALTGSLIYLNNTRPDLCFVTNWLSRGMQQPTEYHMTVAKRVLRYLKGTSNSGVWYSSTDKKVELMAYSDAGEGKKKGAEGAKYTTGYATYLDASSSPLSWATKLQKIVAQSTTEAEFIAINETKNEVLWLRKVLQDLDQVQHGPSLILGDNQGSLDISKNPESIKRTKHIDNKYQAIIQQVREGRVSVEYCETGDMIADIFTKPLPAPSFAKHAAALICTIPFSPQDQV